MKRLASTSTVVWDAEEYHNLSFAQNSAAKYLIQQLKIKTTDSILDVGCGNGKISAKLAEIANEGKVVGIDKSKEMIAFSAENVEKDAYPNLRFKLQDANKVSFRKQFNVIFSSFALQWIQDKNKFFQKSYNSLKQDGTLALIVPTGVSPELELSVSRTINDPKWKGYFQDFHPNWYFCDGKSIRHLITENSFRVTYFEEMTQEVTFPSRDAFERYVLLWFPYLRPLPKDLRKEFFQEVLERYFTLLPIDSTGTVLLRIPRVDIIAKKSLFN